MSEIEAAKALTQSTPDSADHLVRRLRENDSGAYAELCARFGRPLHLFIASHLHADVGTIEDVLLQTFADAVRNIGHYNPRRSTLSAWLFGIVRRKIHDELRRQSRRKSIPESAQVPIQSLPEQYSADDMAGALIARIDAQRQIALLEDTLSGIEMEALVLFFVHRMSLKEISHIIGRSERAVDSLLHRAKQKARERLANEHG